jgi:hypothetical protein
MTLVTTFVPFTTVGDGKTALHAAMRFVVPIKP